MKIVHPIFTCVDDRHHHDQSALLLLQPSNSADENDGHLAVGDEISIDPISNVRLPWYGNEHTILMQCRLIGGRNFHARSEAAQ